MIPKMMKAVVLTEPTKAENVKLIDYPVPKIRPGWVLVKVKAFGMNYSEQILRLNEIQADYIQKPIIPGIECVGEIADPSDSRFQKGQKIVAVMGGMGRCFHGSYAEYALLPEHHVFSVNSSLSWTELAAIPETYLTAWGSLFECLQLRPEDTLLIRGGTCSLGYATAQLAKALGCYVITTTHKKSKLPLLDTADQAIFDTGNLAMELSSVTKALELVGPKTLYDTLRCVKKGGVVCHTGILGGLYTLNGFDPIRYIPNGVYLTSFYSNSPTQKTVNEMFSFLNKHSLIPCVGATYSFADITRACMDMDEGKTNGKIVVEV